MMGMTDSSRHVILHGKYSTCSAEIEFLENLNAIVAETPDVSQREISRRTGISLGIVNGLLNRCADRGWIALKNINKCKLAYIITPEGMNELFMRSISFMRRNFAQLRVYSENIDRNIERARSLGKAEVLLVGNSELQLFIEQSCKKHGMAFSKTEVLCPGVSNCNRYVILGDTVESRTKDAVSVFDIAGRVQET